MVIKDGHGVYKTVNEPPALVQLAHIQFAETANPECHIFTGEHGLFDFLLDDMQLDFLFPFLQLVKALFRGLVDNPHLDSVQHIFYASLGFCQLLTEGGEFAAFLALQVHYSVRYVLHEIIIHHFRHGCVYHGIFQRQLADALVFGGASLVLLGVHTAVIMVLPAFAGAGAALAHHHSPAGAAKEFRSQKIIVLGLVTGWGFPVCFEPLLHPVEQVLRDDSGNTAGGDDMAVTVFPDILPVFQQTGNKIQVDFPAPYCGKAAFHKVLHDLFHSGSIGVPGETFQHYGGGVRVDLIAFLLVDDKAKSGRTAVILAFQGVLRMAPDDFLG